MNNKKQKGFTIVELIISIFILAFAVVGIYTAFSMTVVLTRDASSRFVAAYLAQEGIEIVRNIRENNWLKMSVLPLEDDSMQWNTGLTGCETGCELDYRTLGTPESPLTPWPASIGGNILYIGNDFLYSYDIAWPTKFRRKVTITLKTPDILSISSEVFWEEKSTILGPKTDRSIKAEEDLYDWY